MVMKAHRTRLVLLIVALAPILTAATDTTGTTRSDDQVSASQPRVTFFRDSSTERQPALTVFPTYPSIARRDRIQGQATVCFKIDARGKVKRVSVASYSHRIFRKPALRAIKKSNFEPLRPNQVMARAKTCRTYRFRLDPILANE